MPLFKKTLDFQKTEGGLLDKRGAKRYPRDRARVNLPPSLKGEVQQLFQVVVPNLGKGVPAEVRKFLELFAV